MLKKQTITDVRQAEEEFKKGKAYLCAKVKKKPSAAYKSKKNLLKNRPQKRYL